MKRITNISRPARGFTIVELVVAFIIIAILASILVPTMINRAEQARMAATKQELQHLGDAEERVGIDTGFMLRIYALDDVGRPGDGIASTDSSDPVNNPDVTESILDNQITNNNCYVDPERLFISAASENYSANGTLLFDKLLAESAYSWLGPYLQWQRDENGNDWPDDPWGNDYLFFTRAGVIFPPINGGIPAGTGGEDGDGSAQFQPTYRQVDVNGTPVTYDAIVFDRPTFLSMGPDNLPGNGLGNPTTNRFGDGDDIIYQIGGVSGQVPTSTP